MQGNEQYALSSGLWRRLGAALSEERIFRAPRAQGKAGVVATCAGDAPKWTTYTYDALGRTLSVSLPDGGGSTTYAYAKEAVTITDAAGKWKRYETNGLGELVKVVEPNPAGGVNLETAYAYNLRRQLTSAVMTRSGVTQTGSFQYDLATGHLLSVTKPETGTTSYVYNADGTVLHVTDAKKQRTQLSYDSLKRLTAVRRSIGSGSTYTHQECQDVDYVYDSLSGGGSNLWGRLAQVTSKFCNDAVFGGYRERYSYRGSGELTWRNSDWLNREHVPLGATLRVEAAYNVMGQMTSYGFGWPSSEMYSYAISYDTALRPVNLSGENLALVGLVTYNAAGAATSFTRQDAQAGAVTNTYDFNSLYQMTGQTVMRGSTKLQELTYAYHATQNNGQMLSQTDALSAETVLYQYDALSRLTKADLGRHLEASPDGRILESKHRLGYFA